MANLAKILTNDGWSYQLTETDVLWAGRMIAGEGASAESAHVLWTMAQLYTPAGQRGKYGNASRFTSFTDLIQAYSQPINPRWRRDGYFCKPGGPYHGQDNCSAARLARRDQFAVMPLTALEPAKKAILDQWATGALPNPVPRAVEFADPGVSAAFIRRNPGSETVARPGNWYIVTPYSKRWVDGYVRMARTTEGEFYIWGLL